MTEFDYVVLAIVSLSVAVSILRGLVREILSRLNWAAAFYLANRYSEEVALQLSWAEQLSAPMKALVGCGVVFFLSMLLGSVFIALITRLVSAAGLSFADRGLGMVFGALRGGLIVVMLVIAAGLTSLPEKEFWREAVLSGYAEDAVRLLKPHLPPSVVKWVKY